MRAQIFLRLFFFKLRTQRNEKECNEKFADRILQIRVIIPLTEEIICMISS